VGSQPYQDAVHDENESVKANAGALARTRRSSTFRDEAYDYVRERVK